MRAANRSEQDETPDASWQEAYGDLVSAAQETFREGKRVLVVGGPAGTFDQRLMRERQLLFWPTAAAKHDDQQRVIPVDVGMALVCTLVSARLQMHVRSQVRERSLRGQHPSVLSPGTITRVLRNALILQHAEERAAVVKKQTWKPAPLPEVLAAVEVATVEEPPPLPTAPAIESLLVGALDDAIAALQLAREQAVALEARVQTFNGVNPEVLEKFLAFRRALRES